MDDHLPSGSPLQQHLSIGLGIEPFTGPSGWLPTQGIYMMVAILGKHGYDISTEYSKNMVRDTNLLNLNRGNYCQFSKKLFKKQH